MEFGKHLGKGLWGFADKVLPAFYGVAFMFLVIRVLPSDEYGAYFLFQTIFTLVASLAFSLSIQPMLKYVAEGVDAKSISSTAMTMMILFLIITVGLLLLFSKPVTQLLDAKNAEKVRSLLMYLPFMFAVSIYRTILSGLLQAKLKIKELFFTDAMYFLSSFILVIIAKHFGILKDAVTVINIGLVSSFLASIVAFFLSRQIAIPVVAWNKGQAKKIFNYGKYGLGGTVGNVVQTQFDTFFISAYGGVNGVAYYGAAKNFIRVYDMYSQVIQMLVLPASSMLQGRKEEHKLPVLVEKSICFSLYAILPVVIIFEIFPIQLFHVVYGDRYDESIHLFRVLGLIGFVIPFGGVISSVIFGIGKTGVGFIMSLVSLGISSAVYYFFGSTWSVQGIVWGVVTIYVIVGSITLLILKRYVPFKLGSIFKRTSDIIAFFKKLYFFS